MPHTRRTYHTMIDKHLKSLHHIELKKLKPLHLQPVLKEMYDKGLSDNMMRDTKIIASAILNFAMDNDLLFRNVFARVSVPKRGKAERQPITEEQKNLILRTWRGHRMPCSRISRTSSRTHYKNCPRIKDQTAGKILFLPAVFLQKCSGKTSRENRSCCQFVVKMLSNPQTSTKMDCIYKKRSTKKARFLGLF